MSFWIIAIFVLLIFFPLCLAILIPTYIKHYKASGGIINYNSTMRKFVYKVDLKSSEILERLNTRNSDDKLACSIDVAKSTVNFSDFSSNEEYYFYVQEYDGFSILKLELVALIRMQSYIPYKLNPFLVSKLQAEIIPFSQYEF